MALASNKMAFAKIIKLFKIKLVGQFYVREYVQEIRL